MYIIDDTYFQRELAIPNTNDTSSKASEELEQYIDEKCRLLILNVLPLVLVNEFDDLLVNGILPNAPETPVKWLNMVYGCEYELGGKTLKWNGLRYEQGTYKSSLLAEFTFYHWLKDNQSYVSGVGESKGNPKGATLVNSTQRLVTVWNRFVKAYQCDLMGNYPFFYDYTFNYQFYYPIYEHHTNDSVSFIQFLNDNAEDYPNVTPKHYALQNQLGL